MNRIMNCAIGFAARPSVDDSIPMRLLKRSSLRNLIVDMKTMMDSRYVYVCNSAQRDAVLKSPHTQKSGGSMGSVR